MLKVTKCKLQITTVREISLFCYAFLDFFNILYIGRYRNIGFLNHQIFVSVSALKILYRSGSNSHHIFSHSHLLLAGRMSLDLSCLNSVD